MRRKGVSRVGLALAAVALLAAPAAVRADELLFGFNDNGVREGRVTPRLLGETAAEIKPAGVLRMSVSWSDVQPRSRSQRPDFSRYERTFERLPDGYRVLAVLCCAPRWAWGGELCGPLTTRCSMPPGSNPRDLAAWQRFVRELVEHHGDRLAGIEVLNEPNVKYGGWTRLGGVDAVDYAQVACAAAAAANEADPGVPVVSAGLVHTSTHRFLGITERQAAGDFLAEAFAAGLGDCVDAVGVHPYPQQQAPDAAGDSRYTFIGALTEVDERLAAIDPSPPPLWITEYGVRTGGGRAASWREQREWNLCGLRLAARGYDRFEIDAFILHQLFDKGWNPLVAEHNWGIHRAPAGRDGPVAAKGGDAGTAGALRRLFATHGDDVPPVDSCAGL